MKVWILVVTFALTSQGEIVSPIGASSAFVSRLMNTYLIDNIKSEDECHALAERLAKHAPEANRVVSCVEVEKATTK